MSATSFAIVGVQLALAPPRRHFEASRFEDRSTLQSTPMVASIASARYGPARTVGAPHHLPRSPTYFIRAAMVFVVRDVPAALVCPTILPFSGERKRERSDRCVRPPATAG